MEFFAWSTLVLLLVFSVLGMVDGLYLHIWKFRLYARPEARAEHAIHAARAVLFVPVLLWVLTATTSGFWLWLGLGFAALDFGVQLLDTRVEADSRRFQGGLPNGELALHLGAALSHVLLLVTSLLSRPTEAFFGTTPITAAPLLLVERVVMQGLLGGSILMALLHLALLHPGIVTWVEERRGVLRGPPLGV